MNLSKSQARDIAKKLAMHHKTEGEQLKRSYFEMITQWYIDSIPKIVIDAFDQYPDYFKNYNRDNEFVVEFDNGKEINDFYFTQSVPYPDYSIDATDDLYQKIEPLMTQSKTLLEIYNTTVKEISDYLLLLGTYDEVKKHFVEAIQFFPTSLIPISDSPSENVDRGSLIREKLNLKI